MLSGFLLRMRRAYYQDHVHCTLYIHSRCYSDVRCAFCEWSEREHFQQVEWGVMQRLELHFASIEL